MSNVLQPLLYGIIKKYHDVRIEIDKALANMVEDGIITRRENVNGMGMYAPINAKVTQSE